MTVWGLRVKELLDAKGQTAAWLSRETGIARSTISNWLNNPSGVQPKPGHVAKVAKAFKLEARDLAPYGGYPIITSKDDGERQARKEALAAMPRLAQIAEDIATKLSPRDQDTALSMVEAFIASRQAQKGSQ